MYIHILGTGYADSDRTNASILIDENILVDVGPSVPRKLFSMNILPDTIVLTHFHGDHILGIPILLLKAGKFKKITIYAFREVLDRVKLLWDSVYGIYSLDEVAKLIPFEHGDTLNLGEYKLRIVQRPHGDIRTAVLLFEDTIAYATDVREIEEDYCIYSGLDAIIHEVGYGRYHTDPEVLGKICSKAGVEALFITHYPDNVEEIESKLSKNFGGMVRFLRDDERIVI